jgi:hypothetical protein
VIVKPSEGATKIDATTKDRSLEKFIGEKRKNTDLHGLFVPVFISQMKLRYRN